MAQFRGLVGRIARTAERGEIEEIAKDLTELAAEITTLLETHVKSTKTNAHESQIERHIKNSNPQILSEFEPTFRGRRGHAAAPAPEPAVTPQQATPKTSETTPKRAPRQDFPLGMVLDACPDILDYAKGGVANWRDLQAIAAAVVRPMLGISPSAWEEAQAAMGEIPAAIVVAAILQKGMAVTSAGGYLRELARKANEGQFTLGPMLMALIAARKREKMRA